ncbi:MAG TPA: ABC transporter ATP-binding protein [Burkholderiales bacterium]|nr:ABC transporter ATP-binding protein [Burkholderiales bacterium]
MFRGVHKRFGALEVLRGLDLDIAPRERHALIGPNGAGKSTLFDIATGRIPPTSGEVVLNGRKLHGLAPHERARLGLARSFQITSLFRDLCVFENLRCAVMAGRDERYRLWMGADVSRAVQERADEVLSLVGLEARRSAPVSMLSYAEQRALELGVTIAGGAGVLLLDEPTAGMSRPEARAAVELIRRVSEGRSLFIIEHDMDVVFGLADRVSVLAGGELIASGTPEAIRADAAVRAAYLGTAVGQ